MSIDGIDPIGGLNKAEQRTQKDARPAKPAEAGNEPAVDTVEVGRGETSRLAAEVASLPDVRAERVEALQTAIAQGSYQVPAEDIAASIIEELV